MQNKGFVRLIAILIACACVYSLSFTCVTSYYNSKAKAYAGGDKMKEYQYLDSISGEKVWLGYTLKECREREINLGLDLKGGMNVTLEVSVPDILRSLSNGNDAETFNKAIAAANLVQQNSQDDYVDIFCKEYLKLEPNAKLASVFSSMALRDKVTLTTSNEDVEKVLKQEVNAAIDNSFNVLRTRIDRFGVVQPNIQRLEQAGRILVELPGVKEPGRVRKLLQGTANLEFWETYNFGEISQALDAANTALAEAKSAPEAKKDTTAADTAKAEKKDLAAEVAAAKTKKAGADTTATKDADIEKYKAENPLWALLQPSQMPNSPVVGMARYVDTAAINKLLGSKTVRERLPRDVQFRWTVKPIDEAETVYQLIAIKVNSRDGKAPLEGDVITSAEADYGQNKTYAEVSMSMNPEGAKTWARLTKDNIGKSIAICLDGYIYSFPTVQCEIDGGRSSITGNFTIEEATDLANTLSAGKMPAPARIVQEDIVGPSLGAESIKKGFISFAIAFLLILIYMCFYYGMVPGLIADAALVCNIFFLVGALAAWGAVLTLPGIAGIVLTMGMAVDANVLIYERIREEMKGGKSMRQAIAAGYSGAISAIIDSNVTTLLTGIVLSVFGSGPIKGFAVTLIIGILTSFATAVFISRLLLERYADRENAKSLSFTTNLMKNWLQNTHVDFLGKRKYAYIFSGTLILVGIVSMFTHKFDLGIDFAGGRNYIVAFDHSVKTDEIREMLEPQFGDAGVQVIAIGNDQQVRISTKYKIDDNGQNVDNEIEALIYEGVKSQLPANETEEQFVENNIVSSQKVGPTIADDIMKDAFWAVLIALIVIALYILLRFRNFAYSVGALASLTHDSLVIIGLYSLLWGFLPFSMEINQSFIAAILTVIGYSINDTVVIFDRIRENTALYPHRDRWSVINESINSTLSRTFSTSMSTFVVLLAIFCLGGETIRGFVFAILLGVIFGTYSTWFIAIPLSYDAMKKQDKKAAVEA